MVSFRLDVATRAGTVRERLVLQWALSAPIADRTIERVIQQQEFEDAALGFLHDWAAGADDHPLGHGGGACRDGPLGLALDLNQAGSTGANRAKFGVITKDRNVDAVRFASFPQEGALRHLHFVTVDRESYVVFQFILRSIRPMLASVVVPACPHATARARCAYGQPWDRMCSSYSS